MAPSRTFYDALGRWAEVAGGKAAQLVRITELDAFNRYKARPIAFDAQGGTTVVGTTVLTVVNLAEPANLAGQVPAGTDVVAVDVEGRWVVFVRRVSEGFAAKVISSEGGALYTVRRQLATGSSGFTDDPQADDVVACNLAELSLGPGAAVDAGRIVLVTTVLTDGTPPSSVYVFDHPAYAKYLE